MEAAKLFVPDPSRLVRGFRRSHKSENQEFAMSMKSCLSFGALLAMPMLALACGVQAVVIGKNGSELDACAGTSVLVRDSVLYPAPHEQPDFTQVLPSGSHVEVCDGTTDGEWSGVVLPLEGEDCGVSRPVETPRRYAGPCRSGWVRTRDLEVVAG